MLQAIFELTHIIQGQISLQIFFFMAIIFYQEFHRPVPSNLLSVLGEELNKQFYLCDGVGIRKMGFGSAVEKCIWVFSALV